MTEVAEQETQEVQGSEEDAIAAQMGEENEQGAVDSGVGEEPVEGTPTEAYPDAAPTDDGDPEPEPESESDTQPSTEAVSEEIGKKLDALQKHVAKKMGDILGEDVTMFEVCEVCSYTNTPGWRLSGPYPPDVETAVRHAMGQHAPAEYKTDGYSSVCTQCEGLGQTQSRSKVPGQDLLVCYGCKGRGWVPVGPERGGAPLVVQSGDTISNAENGEVYAVTAVEPELDSPEIAKLKADGYIIIQPTSFNS